VEYDDHFKLDIEEPSSSTYEEEKKVESDVAQEEF
jgi:hypothetical protein